MSRIGSANGRRARSGGYVGITANGSIFSANAEIAAAGFSLLQGINLIAEVLADSVTLPVVMSLNKDVDFTCAPIGEPKKREKDEQSLWQGFPRKQSEVPNVDL